MRPMVGICSRTVRPCRWRSDFRQKLQSAFRQFVNDRLRFEGEDGMAAARSPDATRQNTDRMCKDLRGAGVGPEGSLNHEAD